MTLAAKSFLNALWSPLAVNLYFSINAESGIPERISSTKLLAGIFRRPGRLIIGFFCIIAHCPSVQFRPGFPSGNYISKILWNRMTNKKYILMRDVDVHFQRHICNRFVRPTNRFSCTCKHFGRRSYCESSGRQIVSLPFSVLAFPLPGKGG